jgi:cytochrome P450
MHQTQPAGVELDAAETSIENFDLYEARPLPELHRLNREFREKCPVARSEQNGGFWYVTSYEHVNAIVRDTETFSNSRGIIVPPIEAEPLIPNDLDPPEHEKYRALLQPWLSVRSVRRFEPQIRQTTQNYLAALESPCDMVAGFALPLALDTITTVLGVPSDMRGAMVTVMQTILGEAGADPANAAEAMGHFGQFVQDVLIEPRRAQGPTADPADVVDLMVGAQIDGRPFTDQEIRQTVLALLGAGFETTYKGLAASLWYLAQQGEAWTALKSGEVPFKFALEELLRFVTPVNVGRTATRDVTLGDQVIKEGDMVLMCLQAVNRDDTVFPNPDSLNLSRPGNRHLTFGAGIHRCIGMHLARLELTIALEEVLQAFERIWMPSDAAPVFSGSQAAGIVKLPMAFTRST